MSNRFGRTIALAAALLSMVVIAPGCKHSGETPKPTETVEDVVIQEKIESVEDVSIEAESVSAETEKQALDAKIVKSPADPKKWKKIPPVEVSQGGGVRFTAEADTAWIIIPDAKIRRFSGGKDWARGKSFIAFKVKDGDAVVMVPSNHHDSKTPVVIHYSVLAQNPEGEWDYVHGDNPPPRMIIKPR